MSIISLNLSWATQENVIDGSEKKFVEMCQKKYKNKIQGLPACTYNACNLISNYCKKNNVIIIALQEGTNKTPLFIDCLNDKLSQDKKFNYTFNSDGISQIYTLYHPSLGEPINENVRGVSELNKNLGEVEGRPVLISYFPKFQWYIINAHFPHFSNVNFYQKIFNKIGTFLKNKYTRITFCGDFNDSIGYLYQNSNLTINNNLLYTGDDFLETCCYPEYDRTGDYIFDTKKPSKIKILQTTKLTSDHKAIVAIYGSNNNNNNNNINNIPSNTKDLIIYFRKSKLLKPLLYKIQNNKSLTKKETKIINLLINNINVEPIVKSMFGYFDNVFYDPVIDEYCFIIPKGTLFFRGEYTETNTINELLYTYGVPCMAYGVNFYGQKYKSINVYRATKDLKFIVGILPSPRTKKTFRKFNNEPINKNNSLNIGKMTYSSNEDAMLVKKFSQYRNIDGIMAIDNSDAFYDGETKKLESMAEWLSHSLKLGIPIDSYCSHFNIDNNNNIGYTEFVIFGYNTPNPYKLEIIKKISDKSNKYIENNCRMLLDFLMNQKNLYWDVRTGLFVLIDNLYNPYFSNYNSNLIYQNCCISHNNDIKNYLLNSDPFQNTNTKLQYINEEILQSIINIINAASYQKEKLLLKIPYNIQIAKQKNKLKTPNFNTTQKKNNKINYPNNSNNNNLNLMPPITQYNNNNNNNLNLMPPIRSENFSGGRNITVLPLNLQTLNRLYAHYCIPTPQSLYELNSSFV